MVAALFLPSSRYIDFFKKQFFTKMGCNYISFSHSNKLLGIGRKVGALLLLLFFFVVGIILFIMALAVALLYKYINNLKKQRPMPLH